VRDGEVQVTETAHITPVRLNANTVVRAVNASTANAAAPLLAEQLSPIEVDRRLSWQRG
jgi:hypothetical protein